MRLFHRFTLWIRFATLTLFVAGFVSSAAAGGVQIATFETDATPPVGSPLAYDPMIRSAGELSCRGVVITGSDLPIVLCAVDWIGIGNGGYKAWTQALAEAAGTVPERVVVHTLHQHDAPLCDFTANELLAAEGLNGVLFDPVFARETIARAAAAVRQALTRLQPVTHLGLGQSRVEKVASNRRILGPDGKVAHVRWTATRDPELRAQPEGLIDPYVRLISFWNGDSPLAVLSYYATHPQSYYRTGVASPDFPGLARTIREQTTQVMHIHFNGAGGNIGAGKWNDGSVENRGVLAQRLAEGMRLAWEQTAKQPITASDVGWEFEPVQLPVRSRQETASLERMLKDPNATVAQRKSAATDLAWLLRSQRQEPIDIPCLKLGPARVIHLPGEPVVEYQLAAARMRPDLFVAVAGYTDYGPGYVCLTEHYAQGGYEDSEAASRVAPEVEQVLLPAMRRLLTESDTGLRRALTFYAPFDRTTSAAYGNGDLKLYWMPSMKEIDRAEPGLPTNNSVRMADGKGRFGDALRFDKKTPAIVFFQGKDNLRYQTTNWQGTVSFWLRLSPGEQLETGYCDPIQITPRAWNDAAFFVEFEKRDGPVPFRLGVYPDFKVWNPQDRKWNDIPFAEKPLLEVKNPPFSRERWTHVLFTFERFNTGAPNGTAKLYLNGEYQGQLTPREQTFHWDPDKNRIMLGLNYVGYYDELAIFSRALEPDEIRELHALPSGIAGLLQP